MEEIIQILMNRDGVERDDAVTIVKECQRRLLEEAVPDGDYEAAIDIVAEELGLEPDYIIYLI